MDEGDVVLTYPKELSEASFDDLKSYLEVFLRKAQRRAKEGAQKAVGEGDADLIEGRLATSHDSRSRSSRPRRHAPA